MRAAVHSAILLLTTALPALGAQPRMEYANPVAGSKLVLSVDRAEPGSQPSIFSPGLLRNEPLAIDGSGCGRFEVDLAGVAPGTRLEYLLLGEDLGELARVQFVVQAPTLLLTGVAGREAWLYRVPMTADPAHPFAPNGITVVPLGPGVPGGAVRDARLQHTFVIADAVAGRVLWIDDASGVHPAIPGLPGALRAIAATPDGRSILITSAGTGTSRGKLIVLDAAAPLDPSRRRVVELDPFGADGGRIAISDDGLSAFVSVHGLYLRDVNLLTLEAGRLPFAVGGPGQDEIRDLRIVDGSLFALTGSRRESAGPNALTGFDVADPRRDAQLETPGALPHIGLATSSSTAAVLLVDATYGEVTVIDARTMLRRGSFSVPPGADALLLSPNPHSSLGALLYRESAAGASALPIDLDRFAFGDKRDIGAARYVPVTGRSDRIDHLFVAIDGGGILALAADAGLATALLPLPIEVMAISAGR